MLEVGIVISLQSVRLGCLSLSTSGKQQRRGQLFSLTVRPSIASPDLSDEGTDLKSNVDVKDISKSLRIPMPT